MSVAVEQGAAIIPYSFDYASAKKVQREQSAVLAAQRRNATPEHPYSLPPHSLKRLELGSPCRVAIAERGHLLRARLGIGVKHVLIGSSRNVEASVKVPTALGDRIAVIAPSGLWSDGRLRPASEDYVSAGAIVSSMDPDRPSLEAAMVAWSFEAAGNRIGDVISKRLRVVNCLSDLTGKMWIRPSK